MDIKVGFTSHSRSVYAAGAVAPLASVRHSATLHSHASLQHILRLLVFAFAKLLFATAKRHIPSERYAKWGLKFFGNIV
jgi:hypothetical protein